MIQKCSIRRVADVFFKEPSKKHYLKEISEKSNLAHTSVKRHLQILKRENIIKEEKEKKGKRIFPVYYVNQRKESYKKQKIIINLSDLFESGLIEYIRDTVMPNSIILFGSYLRGEDTEDSDIDIFVESKEQKLKIRNFENKLKRNIQLHFKENIREIPNELKNNIINGFLLYGTLEVFE